MSGRFVISLDFEKYWGVRDHKGICDYEENLKNVDEVVRSLLEMFQKYHIHATWAIVGFLFHDGPDELRKHLPNNQEIYTDSSLNPYNYIRYADLEPREFHFARDIITEISNTPFQEVASHTYSHYYCLEEGQDETDFRQDLDLFQAVSKQNGNKTSTIIFPRNQVNANYIPLLKKCGITAYRGNEEHYIYAATAKDGNLLAKRTLRFLDRYINLSGHNTYVLKRDDEVSNVRSSRFLAPCSSRLKALESLRLNRIKKSMTYAATNNQIFHLWWHPHNFGRNISENMVFLEHILEHFRLLSREYGMISNNIREVVEELTLCE